MGSRHHRRIRVIHVRPGQRVLIVGRRRRRHLSEEII